MLSSHIRAEIFCGDAFPAGGVVSAEAFDAFLKEHCTFQGFSVYIANGHWRDNDPAKWSGKERTRVIAIYGPANKAFEAEILKLAGAYKQTFGQDAVGVGISPAAFDLV